MKDKNLISLSELNGILKNGRKKNTKKDCAASSFAYVEQDFSNALLGTKEIAGYDPPACIHIHSIRHRLVDPDGISAKAVIDGITKIGFFKDDSASFIKEIRFSQEKGDPEQTIITIYEEC